MVMNSARALSKITVRENATANGVARKTIAAMIASSPPHTRLANHQRNAAPAIVKRNAGRRAAVSVGPSTSITAASAAK